MAFADTVDAEDDETTEALAEFIEIAEDELTKTADEETVEEVVRATEEFDALTGTDDEELAEAVVKGTEEFDMLVAEVETATEELDMVNDVVDKLADEAELLIAEVVPF